MLHATVARLRFSGSVELRATFPSLLYLIIPIHPRIFALHDTPAKSMLFMMSSLFSPPCITFRAGPEGPELEG